MADQVRVFVSHHHSADEDRFTARLVADLEAAGADVWVDDQRITSDDFIKHINEGLAGRQWLVLVMTPDALRSEWVQAEVNAALNRVRKRRMLGVVPIVAEPCDDNDIPALLDVLHRYDATVDYGPARDKLLQALGLPQSVDAVVALHALFAGHDMFQDEQTPSADTEVVFERLAHEYDMDSAAWADVGQHLLGLHSYNEALVAFDRALELDSDDPDIWYSRGDTLDQLGRTEEALVAYDRVIALNPHSDAAWFLKGLDLEFVERYEEALAAYDRALALDPDEADYWACKGSAFHHLLRYHDALAALDRATLINPTHRIAWQEKADILRTLGRMPEAEAAERRAKELGG